MTQLDNAMDSLKIIFDQYAGDDEKLNKAELKTLLEKEMPCLLKIVKEQDEVDKLLKGLDCDGDSEVDFNEFMAVVNVLACVRHGRCSKK